MPAPFKSTIARRGLMLILVPLALASTCLFTLNQLWLSTCHLSSVMHAQNEVLFDLTNDFADLVLYCYDRVTVAFHNKPHSPVPAKDERASLLRRLEELSLENPSQQGADLLHTGAAFCEIVTEVERIAPKLESSNFTNNVQRLSTYIDILRSGLAVSEQVQIYARLQQKHQEDERQKQNQLNGLARAVILIGVAITVLSTAVLLGNFVPNVLVRLRKLSNNARKIVGEPLDEIGGDDELSYLNSVFLSTSERLRQAKEDQQQIMQIVAHEILTPIMALQELAHRLKQELGEPVHPVASNCCRSIEKTSAQVLSFVGELLTAEKVEAGQEQLQLFEFSIREVADECIVLCTDRARQSDIRLVNECGAAVVRADRPMILHVMLNYLSNAVKFSPPSSIVRICAADNGDSVTVSVFDQGKGISEEVRAHVFEKYYQGAAGGSEASGWGLGLWICKNLIEKHSGSLGVNVQPGAGTEFWFTLPDDPACRVVPEPRNVMENPANVLRKPSLIRQGLVLAFLPIIAQSGCLLWMNGQLTQAERLEELERKQTDLAVGINRLWLSMYDAGSHAAFYMLRNQNQAHIAAQKAIEQLNETISDLDREVADFPQTDLANVWFDVRNFAKADRFQLSMIIAQADQDGNQNLQSLAKILERFPTLAERIQRFQKEQLSELAKARREQDEFSRHVQVMIWLAVAGNLLVTLSLWLLYQRTILRRVQSLVLDAEQLTSLRPLPTLADSSDELGQLAEQLRVTSNDLKEADERRKLLLSMVAHDVRSPLTTMRVAIDTIDKVFEDTARTEMQSLIAEAKDYSARVLSLVDDLLSTAKLAAKNEES